MGLCNYKYKEKEATKRNFQRNMNTKGNLKNAPSCCMATTFTNLLGFKGAKTRINT